MELDYRKSYQEYKAELEKELGQTAEGYVRIGYLLKIARDTEILQESGYANVVEFAKAEYGIDKTQVSRFIHINDKFSKNGYADTLEDRYKGFGYAKLSIMLQLPDSINEELTADYSKSEIQAIKEEVDEEKQVTDIEVILEGVEEKIEVVSGDLRRTILQLGEDEPLLYADIWKARRQQDWGAALIQSILAPLGQKQYSIRIRGIGRKLLILKDAENDNTVSLVDLRSSEKMQYTWDDVIEAWERIVGKGESYTEAWEETYLSSWPIKEHVAPVQQNSQKPKPTPKKETKVQKAKKAEKKPEKQVQSVEEQLPGQASIEDYPEYMPEQTVEVIQEATENKKPLDDVCDFWNKIVDEMHNIQEFFDKNCYQSFEELSLLECKEAYNSAINMAAAFERMMITVQEKQHE